MNDLFILLVIGFVAWILFKQEEKITNYRLKLKRHGIDPNED